MTDRDLLELIAQKVTKMDGDITEIKVDIIKMNGEITDLKNEVSNIKGDSVGIKGEIKDLNQKQGHMQSKLNLVSEQTAGLIQFWTEVISRLDANADIQKSLL